MRLDYLLVLVGCASAQPASPAPQTVLAILRQYPGGILTDDRIIYNLGDVTYRISYAVQTTPEAVVAYYDPLLQKLGMEQNPSRGPTMDGLPVDYFWMFYGCPYHGVQITTGKQLQLTYTSGPCL